MAKIYVQEQNRKGTIAPEIYGHFAEHLGRCIYEGLYVGEDSDIPNVNGMRKDVVAALKELEIPVLRWPGGCFADEYHWKDGIGPKEARKKMINTHWGGVVEDNSFGTHEFFELCEQLGCKTYVNGNVGSGTVQEMAEWIEYMTFEGVSPMADLRKENGREKPWKVDFFGVGNENWGCGGNMTPSYYGDLYRRYQTYVRNYQADHKISKICGGPNVDDYTWTRDLLKTTFYNTPKFLHGHMDGVSLHYYVHPEGWEVKGSATDFDDTTWYKTISKAKYMETLIERHGAILEEYDPEKEIGFIVDEWGCWFSVEPGTNPGFLYQQNTMRDALVAGVTLDIFNKHCDRVRMANIAQMINVLQSVILTEGKKMILTPTYHVFNMYKKHQGASLLETYVEDAKEVGREEYKMPSLSTTISETKDGKIHATINNISIDHAEEVELCFSELQPTKMEASILTGAMDTYNTFENPEKVKEENFYAYQVDGGKVKFTIPTGSIVSFTITK